MWALSVRQPWAWALAAGHKDVENRTWKPKACYIGQRIVIHASARMLAADVVEAKHTATLAGYQSGREIRFPEELACGGAIGTAVLARVVRSSESPWFFGPFGLVFRDAELWRVPVACNGALGFWPFPEELVPEGVRLEAGGLRPEERIYPQSAQRESLATEGTKSTEKSGYPQRAQINADDDLSGGGV